MFSFLKNFNLKNPNPSYIYIYNFIFDNKRKIIISLVFQLISNETIQ